MLEQRPWRPLVGIDPRISDAEVVTLAVMQALLGYTSEARWLRFAGDQLRHLFPFLPQQPGYNKRLRKLAGTMNWLIALLARDASMWTDDVWVVDSTPVECARSRDAVRRSDLAGWAEYGYCASHSRYFWGLRLHLLATLQGLPVGFALTGAKADERQVLLDILHGDPAPTEARAGQTASGTRTTSAPSSRPPSPAPVSPCYARPAKVNPNAVEPGSSSPYAKPSSRSSTRSRANSTSNGTAGVPQQVFSSASYKRVLALTAALWHNDATGQPVTRSLLACDH